MATSKSFCADCFSSNDCFRQRQCAIINGHVRACIKDINCLDYYLFKKNNIPTSELVNRVLSRTFLDSSLPKMITEQVKLMVPHDQIHSHLIAHLPADTFESSDNDDDDDDSMTDDSMTDDSMTDDSDISMDFSDLSQSFDGNDDDTTMD